MVHELPLRHHETISTVIDRRRSNSATTIEKLQQSLRTVPQQTLIQFSGELERDSREEF